ncbi:MAG: hypothetical protein AAF845_06335, partial [Bacteroidota bacterium]
IRFDDGDTVVCDGLRRDGDALVRTISVVTDGAYPSRAVLRYRRLGAEAGHLERNPGGSEAD